MAVTGAFSRYQSSLRQRPAQVPGTMADPLLKQFQHDQTVYRLLWDHFTGIHWLDTAGDNKTLKWPLRINYSQAASFIHASCWAGDIPDSSSPVVKAYVEPGRNGVRARDRSKYAEEVLSDVWYENHGRSLLTSANVLAQALGGVVIKLRREPVTGWRREFPMRIEVVQPDLFVGLTNGSDMYDLLEAYVLWEIPLRMAELEYGYKRSEADRDKETGNVIEHWTQETFRITINGQVANYRGKSMSGVNTLGFVPMVYFPHIRWAGCLQGVPITAQLMGLLEEFNGRLADEGDAIKESVHDWPWMRNVRQHLKSEVFGGRKWIDLGSGSGTTGDPAIGRLEAPSMTTAGSFNERLDSLIKQLSFTPEVIWGIDAGSQRSGESRDRLLLPLTMHIEMERSFWTPGLALLDEMIIRMLASAKYGKLDERYFNQRIKHAWHNIYPAERMRLVEEQIVRLGAGVQSPRGALEAFGDVEDIDEVLSEIEAWTEWKSGLNKVPVAGLDQPEVSEE